MYSLITCYHPEYTIGVFGCTGRGKTTFCNFLFKESRFKINKPSESEYAGWEDVCAITSEAQHEILEDPIAGMELNIIDMPGFLATENRNGKGHEDQVKDGEKFLQEFAKALDYVKNGIDVIFVTLKSHARMSAEEELLLEFLDRIHLWPYCVLLFTYGSLAGENEKNRYDGLRKFIATDRCKVECPVLVKMFQRTKGRFMIVESVEQAGDPQYYRSKLDEIYVAIDDVRKDAGYAVNHPLLKMAREAWEAHEIILKDTDRIDKLVQGLNHYMQQSSGEHILVQHLVRYLDKMEGNPELIVSAYSELQKRAEELERNKAILEEELAKLSEKGGLVRRKKIADSLKEVLGNPQTTDDTMPTPSANPRDGANIQEDKRCAIL